MNIKDIKAILQAYEVNELPTMLESYCITQAVNDTRKSLHVDREVNELSARVERNKIAMNRILLDLSTGLRI